MAGQELTNNHIRRGQETNQIWTHEAGTQDTHDRGLTITLQSKIQEDFTDADLTELAVLQSISTKLKAPMFVPEMVRTRRTKLCLFFLEWKNVILGILLLIYCKLMVL